MPNFTATTTITTGRGDTLRATKSGDYNDIFNIRQECDNSTNFINLLSGGTKAAATLEDCKTLIIKNTGASGAEIQIRTKEWTNATPDSNGGVDSLQSYLLASGEYILLPSFRQVNMQNADNSAGDAYQLTNQAPDSNMYVAVNNPAGGDAQLLDEGSNINDAVTNFTVDDGDFFKAGDLIRIDNEIMEVTSVSTDELYVIRATHGSAAASHNDDAALRFPFFNAYADFDKFSTAQTDASGRFKAMNFFGYARTEGEADGLVAGSISGKFYEAGYQELGLSGITSSTNSGLSASTTYYFKIAVDGGSILEISFTTDSSNVNFGGNNGIIQKIQDALNTQFYTESHLYEKKVDVALTPEGDIRFTSGQHLSTSAISLTAGTSGTANTDEFFDGSNAIGRIPASPEAAVAARLPQDTILDRKSGVSVTNTSAFFYDDGHGNILGKCTGTINYETGAIDLQGCPPNANFVVDANYGSAHSGGLDYGASTANCLSRIAARSTNSKINTTIEIIGLK